MDSNSKSTFNRFLGLAKLLNEDIRKFLGEIDAIREKSYIITSEDFTRIKFLREQIISNYSNYIDILNFFIGKNFFNISEIATKILELNTSIYEFNKVFIGKIEVWKRILEFNYEKYKRYDAIWKNMRHGRYGTGFSMENNTRRMENKQYNTKMQKLFMNANKRYRNLKFPSLTTPAEKQAFWSQFSSLPASSPGTPGSTPPGTPGFSLSDSSGGSSPVNTNTLEEGELEEEMANAVKEAEESAAALQKMQEEANKLIKGVNEVGALLSQPLGSVRRAVAALEKGKGGKRTGIVKTRRRKMRKTRRMRGGACPSEQTFAVGVTQCLGGMNKSSGTIKGIGAKVQTCIEKENNKQPGGCNFDLSIIKPRLSGSVTTALNAESAEAKKKANLRAKLGF